jgi:PAS domain S-box-containing protein
MSAAVHALPAPVRDRAETVTRLGIVESPRERSFDRVVELAARICEAPLATLSFVNGDRLWVKASHGTDLRELPLEGAFCRWPVFEGRPCLVPDTLASERFRDHPFVVDEPWVRSYAGVPVFAPDGVSIGSLCVMDLRPRPLTDTQRGALEGLSEQVTALLVAYRQASELAGALDENERLVDRLVERTHRLQEVQRIAAVSAWSLHLPDEVLEVPEATWQLYGLDPQGWPDARAAVGALVPAEDLRALRDAWRRARREGAPFSFRHRILRPDGELRWAQLRAERLPALGEAGLVHGTTQDVTEQVRLHEELLQAQKFETLGRLAGSVAHDVNNVLQAVYGGIDLLADRLPEDDGVLAEVQDAAGRGMRLVRRLLLLASRDVHERSEQDLGALVEQALGMVRTLLPEQVELAFVRRPGCARVAVDPVQLEQVVLNLVVNARDACGARGRIVVAVDAVDLPDGRFARLAVEDSGPGIAPAVLDRIFEPFFSTRKEQGGTGLGLSTVRAVLEESGGRVHVANQEHGGARFECLLPIAGSRAAEAAVEAQGLADPGQGEEAVDEKVVLGVLLVEDQADVRRMLIRGLERLGHRVRPVADGVEALAAIEEEAPDLMISDVAMPRLDGLELVRRLRGEGRTFPVILCSGYSAESVDLDALGPSTFLMQKPFSLTDLRRHLDEIVALRG